MQILAFVRTCKYLGRPANKKLKVGTFLVEPNNFFFWPNVNAYDFYPVCQILDKSMGTRAERVHGN